jgi:hypothetical protein
MDRLRLQSVLLRNMDLRASTFSVSAGEHAARAHAMAGAGPLALKTPEAGTTLCAIPAADCKPRHSGFAATAASSREQPQVLSLRPPAAPGASRSQRALRLAPTTEGLLVHERRRGEQTGICNYRTAFRLLTFALALYLAVITVWHLTLF